MLKPLTTAILALALISATAMVPSTTTAEDTPAETKDKPAYEKAKDLGVEAPEGADILFDGTQESINKNWEMWPKADMAITWKLVDSPTDDTKVLMTDGGKKWGTHDLVTKKKYQDFEAHVEFVMMGARGDGKPDGYANSGVYLQNRYEIQIESPKGKKNIENPRAWKIGPHGIAAFCMERVPDHNVWRDPGTWQSYHIKFTAAKWDKDGNKLEDARATVWWNGVIVHNDVPIKKANGGIKVTPEPGGLKLQEHGQDVRYRNVWIKEIK
ncbi:MAG: DUF1080 domain-containing protein [Planctomycetota bacterium]